MVSRSSLDRRSFVVGVSTAGGAFTLGFAAARANAPMGNPDDPVEVNCWVVIAPDDTVTIRVARSEMGQGALTALAMLVAEELECDWAKVRTEFVSPWQNVQRGGIWGDLSTGASRSISASQDYLRRAGATARDMLISAAATRWNVAVSECRAHSGVITHLPSGRTVSYGVIAADAAKIEPPLDVKLKPPEQWTLLGTPQKRLEIRDKITGHPIYAIDVRLPGMLYAAIRHCPVFGGSVKAVDDRSIENLPGVRRVVQLEDAVAVVADSWWRANKAVQALRVTWEDEGPSGLSTARIGDFVRGGLEGPPGQVGRADGDVKAGLKTSARRIEAEYDVPFLAHATMEPQTCTAHVRPDSVEIWAPTQDASTALATAAIAAGVSDDKVKVNRMLLGGGFGRRGSIQEFIRQAVLIAREVDAPVKLIWSREEDVAHDLYRPFGMARLVAGLDAGGMPVALSVRLAGPSFVAAILPGFFGKSFVDRSFVSGLAGEMPYAVPNYQVDYVVRDTAVPLGVWRGINYTQNIFYLECFIDEMAHEAGIDPYQYRRRLLRNRPKNLAVLDAAAAKAGWDTPPPAGVFRGIAVSEVCGSYCAQVAEISIVDGRVRVDRVVSALDCGHVVNPLTVAIQTEGSIVYALSAALYGEITIKNGAAEQTNFDDYRMLHLAEMPKVETVLVPSGGFWGGVGEPPVVPLVPALCNAVFAATGKRIRSLPLKNCNFGQAI